MKDKGLVIAAKNRSAEVEVNCLEACQGCAAKALCIGQSQKKGILSANNPLEARPGDEVTVDIPEEVYSKYLIFIFGALLVSALMGMAAGYFGAAFLPLSGSTASIIGLFLGLAAAGVWLYFYFRKKANARLFPTITGIIQKGGHHG
jgi:LPXTG-motif cell wall-anchored protein